ncbi:hypothetical protein [Azospirillum brasilense]|nr:hypothetical protein [Azospirillum brasilense]
MRAMKTGSNPFHVAVALAPMLILLHGGPSRADEVSSSAVSQKPPQLASTPATAPAPDPEKDTVVLDASKTRPADAGGQTAAVVRVGQGLRPDGTELVLNEQPRPWLIKQ